MMFEQYRDMNTGEKGIDYETFYDELQSTLNEIRGIASLNDLEKFLMPKTRVFIKKNTCRISKRVKTCSSANSE